MWFRPMFKSTFSFDAYNEAGRTGIGPTQVRKWRRLVSSLSVEGAELGLDSSESWVPWS